MLKRKTVFVIGAGASKEVNLPLGTELRSKIAALLNINFDYMQGQTSGCDHIAQLIRRHLRNSGNINRESDYFVKARSISSAMSQVSSIDTFLDLHQNCEITQLCGKLGIVKSIIMAEASSLLKSSGDRFNPKSFSFSNIEKTWFYVFFQLLHDQIPLGKVGTIFDNLTIINFNYDRCIEQYFFYSLQNVYGLSASDAFDLVNRIELLRPYGSLGKWSPHQNDNNDQGANGFVSFGQEDTNLFPMASRIKTFTEQVDDKISLNKISKALGEAETIVFLGFAYYEQNMNLLKITENKTPSKKIFGTAYLLSPSEYRLVKNQIKANFYVDDSSIELDQTKCAEFLSAHSRSIRS